MITEDEYKKSQKVKKITKRMLKERKITCGLCRFFVEENGMCDRDWPGVVGKLSARGARVDHQTRTFCGMSGKGFLPIIENLEEAEVVSEETRRKPGPKPKLKQPGQGS